MHLIPFSGTGGKASTSVQVPPHVGGTHTHVLISPFPNPILVHPQFEPITTQLQLQEHVTSGTHLDNPRPSGQTVQPAGTPLLVSCLCVAGHPPPPHVPDVQTASQDVHATPGPGPPPPPPNAEPQPQIILQDASSDAFR